MHIDAAKALAVVLTNTINHAMAEGRHTIDDEVLVNELSNQDTSAHDTLQRAIDGAKTSNVAHHGVSGVNDPLSIAAGVPTAVGHVTKFNPAQTAAMSAVKEGPHPFPKTGTPAGTSPAPTATENPGSDNESIV